MAKRLTLIKTTVVADRILARVVRILRACEANPKFRMPKDTEISIVPFVNGRERGWAIQVDLPGTGLNGTPVVAFSQNRNSEEIVIYPGRRDYRQGYAYGLDGIAGGWEARIYRAAGDLDKAAMRVHLELLELVGACQKAQDAKGVTRS